MTADDAHAKLVAALEQYADADEKKLVYTAAYLVAPLALAAIALEMRELREALKPVTVPR
jgi:hypothetical protein